MVGGLVSMARMTPVSAGPHENIVNCATEKGICFEIVASQPQSLASQTRFHIPQAWQASEHKGKNFSRQLFISGFLVDVAGAQESHAD